MAYEKDVPTVTSLTPDDYVRVLDGTSSKKISRDDLVAAIGDAISGGAGGVSDGDKGDITVSGSGTVWTVDNAVVSLAKMANLAQDQFIGRTTASTGVPQTATITAAARTVLDDTTIAAMRVTLGLPMAELHVVKPSDETVNNTTSLQDDDHLFLPVAAGESWHGQFTVFYLGNTTADIDFGLTGPTTPTLFTWAAIGARTSDAVVQAYTTAPVSLGTAAAARPAIIPFRIVNASNAGNVQLRWAQSVLTVGDTKVVAGSALDAWRDA